MDIAGKRILIVKPSSLGDVVHTLPLVHAIKRVSPSCQIGWIIQRAFQPLIEHDPAIDRIHPISIPSTSDPLSPPGAFARAFKATLSAFRRLRKELKTSPYDLVLDLHASFRSGLLGLANPGGVRVGFSDAKELNTFFQDHKVAGDPANPHAVDKNLAFAGFLEIRPIAEDFSICVGDHANTRVRAFLNESGASPQDCLIYANPAARWESKHWTAPAWIELADMLIREVSAKVVFGGAPQDLPLIGLITGAMKETPIVAAGAMDLAEAVALLQAAHAYVGVDSGPMHIAAFTGTPVAAIFGPTDPALVGPYTNRRRVIRKENLECLACRKRSCKNPRCMEEISPREVCDAVKALLRLNL
jgi:lipopolysaccharide heptosyltransferase II